MSKTLKAFAAIALMLTAVEAAAESLADVQGRMRARIPEIARLKQEHVIGENREGFLAVVNPPEGDEEQVKRVHHLVEAENADRRKVYAAIAAKTNTPVQQVGRQRARIIYDRAAPGVLLEGPDGRWVPKPEEEER
jgi:uncharacterized protein YdbL (DUF1318 family)